MRRLKENNKVQNLILSFLMLWLLSIPFTKIYAAELPVVIKNILLKITSSIADQGSGNLQKDYSQGKSLSRDASVPLSSLAVLPVQLYFPLNNTDVKHYEGSVFGTTYYATYNYSEAFYNGRTCYLETDSLDGSKTYYGYSESGLQIYGTTIGNDSFPLDTPLLILNDSILNNGGTIQSSTTLTVEGYKITLIVEVTSSLTGSVSVPLGTVDNCRSIEITFSYSIPGESETLDMSDVWILAPEIGKLRIAAMDQFLINRGWLTITGGTVGGQNVIEIINPTVADFEADLFYGLTPLVVPFTDQSSGLINNWSWDFGDGTSSFSKNPTHVYSKAGKYNVSLTVSGTGGSDTEVKLNYIRADPAGADLNNDNKVDLYDAILALQIVVNLLNASEISIDKDVSGDNKFGLADAIYILQNVSGLR